MRIAEWENFYVIVGSSAAALTGLMFVVIALMADIRAGIQVSARQIDAFGTPTVVHFGAVLMQSAILSAPWPAFGGARIALGLYASAAAIYMLIVVKRTLRQREYVPVFEDWLFHVVLPLVAYLIIVAAVTTSGRRPELVLFIAGGAAVLLLFVAIHNAWDTVTFIVVAHWEQSRRERETRAENGEGA